MLLRNLLAYTIALLPAVFALHESEAGVVDWHKPFIGVPYIHSHSLAPSFHRFSAGAGKKATQSVVLTATGANVLAALDAVSGEIGVSRYFNFMICDVLKQLHLAWRYAFDAVDPIASFKAQGDSVFLLINL